ncbi:YdcH family protein [Sphingomonas sp. SAFR-052]|uniref:YdcH family protein n=1 Tax=Sphingomonas sp. SAFR-052 TaxID=3436867 RepID=UPI003F80002D
MDESDLEQRLGMLRIEHRDLDDAIAALGSATHLDQLQLARLKRRKLRLRDEMAAIEDQLIPDIIA